jgi:hypothetical protein
MYLFSFERNKYLNTFFKEENLENLYIHVTKKEIYSIL